MTTDSATAFREVDSDELEAAEVAAIRALIDAAFGDDEEDRFTDDDWAHATGGRHFLLEVEGTIAGHAAVVARELHLGGRPLRTGYVEAVAVDPAFQRLGLGSLLIARVNAFVRRRFELGALGSGRRGFYERMGWRTWQGPSSVRTPGGDRRTPDDDGYILVLETPSHPLASTNLQAPISCDWRPGDVW